MCFKYVIVAVTLGSLFERFYQIFWMKKYVFVVVFFSYDLSSVISLMSENNFKYDILYEKSVKYSFFVSYIPHKM